MPISEEEHQGLKYMLVRMRDKNLPTEERAKLGETALTRAMELFDAYEDKTLQMRRTLLAIKHGLVRLTAADGSKQWIIPDEPTLDWAVDQLEKLFDSGQLSPHPIPRKR
jgi:hypothetical protein